MDTTVLLLAAAAAGITLIVAIVLTSKQPSVAEQVDEFNVKKKDSLGKSLTAVNQVTGSWSAKIERRKQFGERLVRAGLYKQGSAGFFYSTQAVLCGLPVAVGVMTGFAGALKLQHGLLFGVTLGIFGLIIPGFWLDSRKRSRQTAIRRALPDALDLLVVCLEAGMSLPSALQRITRELETVHPMLGLELLIVHREVQLGRTTGEALRSFGERFDLEEVRGLASVITQAEKFGASIVNAIRVHAEVLRHKRMEKARQKAQEATVKLLFPTVFFIFPALFVVILGPAAYQIMEVMSNLNSK